MQQTSLFPKVNQTGSKKEYILAISLEALVKGQTFGRWPLHITLIPWFEIKNINQTLEAVKQVTQAYKVFSLTVGDTQNFGPRQTVPASTIQNPAKLIALHNDLVSKLEELGAFFPHRHYMMDNFRPHISHKAFAKPLPGQQIKIASVYLIEAPIANPLRRTKTVIGYGELDES